MAKSSENKLNPTNKARKANRVQRMKDLEPGIERVKVYLDAYAESQKDPKKHVSDLINICMSSTEGLE